MNYLNKKIPVVLLLLAMGCIVGCKKEFLELLPKGRVIATNTTDYDLLLNSTVTTALSPHIESGDESAAIEPYLSSLPEVQAKAFRWENDFRPKETLQTEWTSLMRWIYVYNKIINEVMDSKGGTEAQKKSIRAEALVNRAWAYFWMVNYYGQPYNAATAATDRAVPKVLVADVTQEKYTFASVQEIYDQIVNDLNTSIPDLPIQLTNRIRSAKATGEALLGKTYMFMGQFDKAKIQLDAAVAHLANTDIPLGVYDLKKEFAIGGSFLPISPSNGPNRPRQNVDQEVLFMRQITNPTNGYASYLVLKPASVALYTPGDFRRRFLTPTPTLIDPNKNFPNGMMGCYGSGGITNIGLSVPDVYLLQAECKARLGELKTAVTHLETFRKLRMPAAEASVPTTIASDQIALTKFILEERIREFPLQGYRWFDMRRLWIDPVYKSTVSTTHIAYKMDGTIANTYTLRPERLTFRIPLNITEQHPEVPQTP